MNDIDNKKNNDELLYQTLVNLIKHLDERIESNQKFFLTSLAALIPLLVFLVDLKTNSKIFIMIGLLLIPLIFLWISSSRRLTLTKLFWIKFIREIESDLFRNREGPFIRQEKSFLEEKSIGKIDQVLIGLNIRRVHIFAAVVYVIIIMLALYFATQST